MDGVEQPQARDGTMQGRHATVLMAFPVTPPPLKRFQHTAVLKRPRRSARRGRRRRRCAADEGTITTAAADEGVTTAPLTRSPSDPAPEEEGHVLPAAVCGTRESGRRHRSADPAPVISSSSTRTREMLSFVEENNTANAKGGPVDRTTSTRVRTSNDGVDLEAVSVSVSLLRRTARLSGSALPPPPPARFAPLSRTFDLLTRAGAAACRCSPGPVPRGSTSSSSCRSASPSRPAQHFLSKQPQHTSASSHRRRAIFASRQRSDVSRRPPPMPSPSRIAASAPAPVAAVARRPAPTPPLERHRAPAPHVPSDAARLAALTAPRAPWPRPRRAAATYDHSPRFRRRRRRRRRRGGRQRLASLVCQGPCCSHCPLPRSRSTSVRDIDHLLTGPFTSTEGAAVASLAEEARHRARLAPCPTVARNCSAAIPARSASARPRLFISIRTCDSRITFGRDGAVASPSPTGAARSDGRGQYMAEAIAESAQRLHRFAPSFSMDPSQGNDEALQSGSESPMTRA